MRMFLKSTPKQVSEILEMRLKGKSFPEIAKKFDKDHTSIIYWCNLYGAQPLIFEKNETKRKIVLTKQRVFHRSQFPIKIILVIQRDFRILKKKKIYNKPFKDLRGRTAKAIKETPEWFMENQKRRTKKKGDGIKTCIRCAKKKVNKKWLLTNYCSLRCWHIRTSPASSNEHWYEKHEITVNK